MFHRSGPAEGVGAAVVAAATTAVAAAATVGRATAWWGDREEWVSVARWFGRAAGAGVLPARPGGRRAAGLGLGQEGEGGGSVRARRRLPPAPLSLAPLSRPAAWAGQPCFPGQLTPPSGRPGDPSHARSVARPSALRLSLQLSSPPTTCTTTHQPPATRRPTGRGGRTTRESTSKERGVVVFW